MTRTPQESHRILRSISGALVSSRPSTNTLIYIAFFAIAASTPYWFASCFLSILPLELFCIEFALVGIVALVTPRAIAAALIFLMIAIDLLSGISKTYYLSPTECLVDLRFLSEFSWSRFFLVAITVILILAVVVGTFVSSRWALRPSKLGIVTGLCSFAFVMVLHDYLTIVHDNGRLVNPFRMSRPSDTEKFDKVDDLWASRYPLLRLRREQAFFGKSEFLKAVRSFDRLPAQSAADAALHSFDFQGAEQKVKLPNIVLVLVESWGLTKVPEIRDSLVQPYLGKDVQDRYTIVQGTVPFYGSTMAGEARELCGNHMGYHIANASPRDTQNCLPNRLAAIGYDDIAAHGMGGDMFQRSDWYAKIGFKELRFKDSFDKQGLPVCIGAFKGTCDAAIAGWIQGQLDTPAQQPRFVYFVTLNSHLPLPNPEDMSLPDTAACSLSPLLQQQKPFCTWYELITNVNKSVANMAASHLARPTIFIVVGDHVPPFVNDTVHDQFSETVVPYVILLPKNKMN